MKWIANLLAVAALYLLSVPPVTILARALDPAFRADPFVPAAHWARRYGEASDWVRRNTPLSKTLTSYNAWCWSKALSMGLVKP